MGYVLRQASTHRRCQQCHAHAPFLLGCSAFESRQRERIKKGFDALQAYSNLRNIEPALTVVEKVWELMDNNPEESWDWEKIIKDMNMDFLIT